ncbi:MAG: ABC transporter substrate-binding protein [Pseudodesulfovibrio sp.]
MIDKSDAYTKRPVQWGVSVLFLALLFIALFVSALPCSAESTVKIAMITAKTGEAGKSNIPSFKGARFVVDYINSRGGILGRQVQLMEYDNLSTPEGSVAAARQAVKDGVVAVVGCNWSSHSIAMAKYLQEAKVPMISHLSTNAAVTQVGDYIFRACFTDSFQGLGLARFARDDLKTRSAVVLVDTERTYSVGLAETFTAAFEKLGGKVIWRGEYGADNIPFESILRTVAKHNPDALFIPGGYADVSGFFGRARELGVKGNFLSSDGIGIKMYDYIGDKADGIYFSTHWSKWVDTSTSTEFVNRFEKVYGPPQEDTFALVYDSFMVLRAAIQLVGSFDHAKVRQALADTPGYKGVTGTIRFDEHGDPIKPMVMNELKNGGMSYIRQVYP